MGDFNFHLEDPVYSLATRFSSSLDVYGLLQHVRGATHVNGHLLDLVISRSADNFVLDCQIGDLFSDHFSIFTTVRAHRPLLPIRSNEFRLLSTIDYDSLSRDFRSCPFVSSPPSSLDAMVTQYNIDSSSLLDRYAPLRRRSIALRPDCLWFSSTIF